MQLPTIAAKKSTNTLPMSFALDATGTFGNVETYNVGHSLVY